MQIAIINNGSVVKVGHYRTLFPYTVFPDSGPTDGWLVDNSCMKVNLFKPYDNETEVLVPSAPYIEGGWVYTVIVRDKTPEETQADLDSKAAQIRSQRNQLLTASDWTQVLDAPIDRTAWAAYRQALRDITSQEGFPASVQWPNDPNYVSPVGNID
jgi:hypothetical protein